MNQDSNPKIYVMQLKELIYTAIFIILTIILIIVMISLFSPNNKNEDVNATAINDATVPYYSYEYR